MPASPPTESHVKPSDPNDPAGVRQATPEVARDVGIAGGINLAAGSDDDGWDVPQPVTLTDGTKLQLYKDGEALHAAYNAMKSAHSRIALEVYIFGDDETGTAFADVMCEKAKQGVAVYLIYDDFGSIKSSKAMFEKMRRAGVRMQKFHPVRPWEGKYSWRAVNRDHRKLFLIDADRAGLGGLNVGSEYAGSWVVASSRKATELWRDNAVGIVGPSARMFWKSFAHSWNYLKSGGRIGRTQVIENIHEGELGYFASAPTMNSPVRPFLRHAFSTAKKSILMTMAYFAPDDDLIGELCRAAKRGVRVRLMLPGRGDVPALITAARSFYEKLMCSGVEIFERQHVILHAKTMVIDENMTIIGSTNLDYRSIEYNLEISAIIRNREFGRQMCDLFENDVHFARQIRLEQWRKRPWLDRFGQWAVSRMRYVL